MGDNNLEYSRRVAKEDCMETTEYLAMARKDECVNAGWNCGNPQERYRLRRTRRRQQISGKTENEAPLR